MRRPSPSYLTPHSGSLYGKEKVVKGRRVFRKAGFPAFMLGVLGLTGCGGSQDSAPSAENQEAIPPAAAVMSAEVQAFVDQGNEAQREGNFEAAMSAYRAAMELDPQHPVPQFGALMVAMATGDEALTDSLSQLLQASSPELMAMLNPDGSMGAGMPANPHGSGMPGGMPPVPEGMTPMGGLPQGHPDLYEVTPTDTIQPDTVGGQS